MSNFGTNAYLLEKVVSCKTLDWEDATYLLNQLFRNYTEENKKLMLNSKCNLTAAINDALERGVNAMDISVDREKLEKNPIGLEISNFMQNCAGDRFSRMDAYSSVGAIAKYAESYIGRIATTYRRLSKEHCGIIPYCGVTIIKGKPKSGVGCILDIIDDKYYKAGLSVLHLSSERKPMDIPTFKRDAKPLGIEMDEACYESTNQFIYAHFDGSMISLLNALSCLHPNIGVITIDRFNFAAMPEQYRHIFVRALSLYAFCTRCAIVIATQKSADENDKCVDYIPMCEVLDTKDYKQEFEEWHKHLIEMKEKENSYVTI